MYLKENVHTPPPVISTNTVLSVLLQVLFEKIIQKVFRFLSTICYVAALCCDDLNKKIRSITIRHLNVDLYI